MFIGVYTHREMSYHRAYSFIKKLKLGHEHVISYLQTLDNENNEALENLKNLKKEKHFYC